MICFALLASLLSAAHANDSAAVLDVPEWLFPVDPAFGKPAAAHDDVQQLSIPGSRMRYTQAQINNPFAAPDWRTFEHEPMPRVVVHGRSPQIMACAYCHTPTGQGRPENAALAGLPVEYLRQQLIDMRGGVRAAFGPENYRPVRNMLQCAAQMTDEEIDASAAYFSKQTLGPRVMVRQGARIPKVAPAHWIYARQPGSQEEVLGERIIEIAPDLTRHERRDDRMQYIAYVPPGSIERGRGMAANGLDEPAHACNACHGAELKGTALAPPLAGRSPTYLTRQLFAFKIGSRANPAAAAMRAVVAPMQMEEMIAAAAYAASLPP